MELSKKLGSIESLSLFHCFGSFGLAPWNWGICWVGQYFVRLFFSIFDSLSVVSLILFAFGDSVCLGFWNCCNLYFFFWWWAFLRRWIVYLFLVFRYLFQILEPVFGWWFLWPGSLLCIGFEGFFDMFSLWVSLLDVFAPLSWLSLGGSVKGHGFSSHLEVFLLLPATVQPGSLWGSGTSWTGIESGQEWRTLLFYCLRLMV